MGLSLKGLLRGGKRILGSPLGGIASKFIPGLGAVSAGLTIANAIGGMRKKRPGTPPIVPPQGQGGDPNAMLQRGAMQAEGQAFGNTGFQGLTDFDPSKAYNEYLGGAEERFRGQLTRGIEDVMGGSVARGRLNTGYLDLDVGDFGRQLASDYRADASSKALQTAGMTGDKYRSLAGLEEGRTDRFLDIGSAQADRSLAAKNADKERKSNRTNAIISGIGTLDRKSVV